MSSKITLLGAHPLERSVSMDVYRKRLCDSLKCEESQVIGVWPQGGTVDTSPNRVRRALSKYVFYPLRAYNTGSAELVHLLDHSSAHLLPILKKSLRKVVTVHDLIPLRDSNGLSSAQVRRFRKNMDYLKLADRLVSVSQYTKGEIVELLGVDESKIVVVPNGVDECLSNFSPSPIVERLQKGIGHIVILSIGSVQPRKNVEILPALFRRLERLYPGKFSLLRVGAYLPKSCSSELTDVLGGRFQEVGFLSDEELRNAYASVQVVIVPSFFEGFGLPVLEAFSAGAAVACSDRSSLPEVAGGLARLFNPDDLEDIVKAVVEASLDNELASRERRIAFSKGFTWRRHVESLLEVYRSLGVELS